MSSPNQQKQKQKKNRPRRQGKGKSRSKTAGKSSSKTVPVPTEQHKDVPKEETKEVPKEEAKEILKEPQVVFKEGPNEITKVEVKIGDVPKSIKSIKSKVPTKSINAKSKPKSLVEGKSVGLKVTGKSGTKVAEMINTNMKSTKVGLIEVKTLPTDTSKDNTPTSTEQAQARKIAKNKQAVDQIIGMLQTIRPDEITNETKDDLIRIHILVRGIQIRYAQSKANEEKKKVENMLKSLNEGKPVDENYLMKTAPGIRTPAIVDISLQATAIGSGKESQAPKETLPPSPKSDGPKEFPKEATSKDATIESKTGDVPLVPAKDCLNKDFSASQDKSSEGQMKSA